MNLQHPAALGGEHIPSRASIYIHSPLRSASGVRRLHSRDDAHTDREAGPSSTTTFKCQSCRSCSQPPVLDNITSSTLPAQLGACWRTSCAFSMRQRIPGRRGTERTNQSRGRRTRGARSRRNHNKSTGVILQLR